MHSYVVFDLETTGLSPVSSEIIEIGAWKIIDDVPVSKFCTLVKPRGYFSRDAQRISGITPDMLVDALEIEEILPSFVEYCERLPLLGHNLPFDYEFVCRKAKPMGFDFTLKGERTGIDTLALARKYYRNKSHKLEDMAKLFNISIPVTKLGYHRAEYDSYITKLIYDRFLITSPTLPSVSVPNILGDPINTIYGKAENYGTLSFG